MKRDERGHIKSDAPRQEANAGDKGSGRKIKREPVDEGEPHNKERSRRNGRSQKDHSPPRRAMVKRDNDERRGESAAADDERRRRHEGDDSRKKGARDGDDRRRCRRDDYFPDRGERRPPEKWWDDKDEDAQSASKKPPPECEKPSFEPSGKLARDTNTFKGVVIKWVIGEFHKEETKF